MFSLRQGTDLDGAEEHLGPLRLEQDFALGMTALRTDIDDHAIENVGDLVAVANALQTIPLSHGLLDILGAAIALGILPFRISSEPVDSATLKLLRRSAGLV